MEVTKDNFDVVFPRFVELLKDCEFYSMDLEMTGINLPAGEEIPPSTPHACPLIAPVEDEIYHNKDAAAQRYAIVQVGISVFHRKGTDGYMSPIGNGKRAAKGKQHTRTVFAEDDDSGGERDLSAARECFAEDDEESEGGAAGGGEEDEQELEHYQPYNFNFYIFPSVTSTKDVRMNPETVANFLSTHGMDFTKWISKGIPYVTAEEATKIRATPAVAMTLVEIEEIAAKDKHLKSFLAKAKEFSANRTKSETAFIDFPFFPTLDSLEIATTAVKLLGLKRAMVEVDGKKKHRVVVDHTIDDPVEDARASREKALGAFKLYEALLKCKRPMLVHNGMSDLLFWYHAFNDAPFKDYGDFKRKIHKIFPVVFDTRTLVTLPCHGHSAEIVQNLGGQYKYYFSRQRNTLKVSFPLGFEHFHPAMLASNSRGAHEAAYDAYMTGVLYLSLRQRLGSDDINAHMNQLAVYGSVKTCVLTSSEDLVLHNAPILYIGFAEGQGGMGPMRVDQSLKGTGLQGRVMMSGGGAVVFCGQPLKSSEMKAKLEKGQKQVSSACSGARVSVIYEPISEDLSPPPPEKKGSKKKPAA